MLVALLERPSQFGATVKSFDATAAGAIPGAVDVGICGRSVLFEECGCGHDLAGLAVATLRYLDLDPGRLHCFGSRALQPLDGGNCLPATADSCNTHERIA
jgi:hypothetical protein